jgi:hypothetical protein
MISLFHTLILAYYFPFSVSLPGSSIISPPPYDEINVNMDRSQPILAENGLCDPKKKDMLLRFQK